MPQTPYLEVKLNNQSADIGNIDDAAENLSINYLLEEPENWQSIQAAETLDLEFPASKNNDKIFNTFWNPQIEDNGPSASGVGTLAITVPGTGYLVGDYFTINIIGTPALGQVTSIGGGGSVTGYVIISPGSGYYPTAIVHTVHVLPSVGLGLTFLVVSVVGSGGSFRELMDVVVSVNGTIPIMAGKYLLSESAKTDKPEYYKGSIYSGNGDWLIDMENLTLWDCVSKVTHVFSVANVEYSWLHFMDDEDHDYVYAPVRYRQPFGLNDDKVNIYALRPSISIYWLIIRAFRQFGYTVSSQFINTLSYFMRLVLPWTWGDFYDINSQITDGIAFKAYGTIVDASLLPAVAPIGGVFYTGAVPGTAPSTEWGSTLVAGTVYVFEGPIPGGGGTNFFQMPNTAVPEGFDNFVLYSFDNVTGTMQYFFNPPLSILPYVGTNVTINFSLSLYIGITTGGGSTCDAQLEIHNGVTLVSSNSILPGGVPVGAGSVYPSAGAMGGYPRTAIVTTPTVYNFSVNNVNPADTLKFRIKLVQTGGVAATVLIMQAGWLDANPTNLGANDWQYDPTTQKWANLHNNTTNAHWQAMYSTFQMIGLQIVLGGNVNFQQYDAFRNYKFLDMLGGLGELFNWEIQTDPINKVVTIEPMFGTVLPDTSVINGYFSRTKILDWTEQRDISTNKPSRMMLFNSIERQIDFSMKQDGSDGGQNIFTARYKSIYLNNVIKPRLNNTSIENGIIAAIPGASRYMLPNRFAKGNKQINNRFFSATMHYNHSKWANIDVGTYGPTIAPQLIAIIPENINDSSASAVTQTFEPKIAFYKGLCGPATDGGWYWEGDPAAPYTPPTAIHFSLPKMFAVNYSGNQPELDPILVYADQNINGAKVSGLMSRYYLQRMAILRNGQLYMPFMRLNLNDICNFMHRECIKLDASLYALIGINGYKPLKDDSCECTMWRIVNPEAVDIANSFPSESSILTNPLILSQYDLKYAQLILFQTDIPQIN